MEEPELILKYSGVVVVVAGRITARKGMQTVSHEVCSWHIGGVISTILPLMEEHCALRD